MSDTSALAPEITGDEIETEILTLLRESSAEFVPWAWLRRRVHGSYWAKAGALDRLWIDGRVYVVRDGGRNFVALGDEHDAAMAAKAKAEGRVRAMRIL